MGTEFLSFLLAKVKENSEAQNLQNFCAILCNPWISSAMAMAMSIYRTLCVLVSFLLGTVDVTQNTGIGYVFCRDRADRYLTEHIVFLILVKEGKKI